MPIMRPEADVRAHNAMLVKSAIRGRDTSKLFNLILIAYYFGTNSLVELLCQTIADLLIGKSEK